MPTLPSQQEVKNHSYRSPVSLTPSKECKLVDHSPICVPPSHFPPRALLNTLMPSLLTKALVAALPRELGDYVIASQEGLSVQGEFKMAGPALSTFVADLSPSSIKVSPAPACLAQKCTALDSW